MLSNISEAKKSQSSSSIDESLVENDDDVSLNYYISNCNLKIELIILKYDL
jgi:hypothetical protein